MFTSIELLSSYWIRRWYCCVFCNIMWSSLARMPIFAAFLYVTSLERIVKRFVRNINIDSELHQRMHSMSLIYFAFIHPFELRNIGSSKKFFRFFDNKRCWWRYAAQALEKIGFMGGNKQILVSTPFEKKMEFSRWDMKWTKSVGRR